MTPPSLSPRDGSIVLVGTEGVALVCLVTLFAIYARNSRSAALRRARLDRAAPTLPPNLGAIASADPAFTQPEFVAFVRTSFGDLQRALAAGSAADVRHLVSHDLFAQLVATVDTERSAGRHHVIDRVKVHDVVIRSAVKFSGWESIVVRVRASCVDFTVDHRGRTHGSRRIRAWEEDWTFERAAMEHGSQRTHWTLSRIDEVVTNRFGAGDESRRPTGTRR